MDWTLGMRKSLRLVLDLPFTADGNVPDQSVIPGCKWCNKPSTRSVHVYRDVHPCFSLIIIQPRGDLFNWIIVTRESTA